MPLHVVGGVGDRARAAARSPPRAQGGAADGRGSGTGRFGPISATTTASPRRPSHWLQPAPPSGDDKPWVLVRLAGVPALSADLAARMVSASIRKARCLAAFYGQNERPHHPFIEACGDRRSTTRRSTTKSVRKAIAAYFGMVSFVDHNLGRLMRALEDAGLDGDDARDLHLRPRR